MSAMRWTLLLLLLLGASSAAFQDRRVESLLAAVAPALPFPRASPDGELPADGQATSKWFVHVADPDAPPVVTVKANPLHPETQKASTAAMARIQTAVEAAERRARASYERAIEELRRTGQPVDVESISLDDEGVEGDRIDADLELTIAWRGTAETFSIESSLAPTVMRSQRGVEWVVFVRANVYREGDQTSGRERFRAAEAHVFLGLPSAPTVVPGTGTAFSVTVPDTPGATEVVLRGNEALLEHVVQAADWQRLASR